MTLYPISGCQDRAAQARAEVRAEQPEDQRGAEGGQEAQGGQRPQAQQARRRATRLGEGQARRQGARMNEGGKGGYSFCCQLYLVQMVTEYIERIAMARFSMR